MIKASIVSVGNEILSGKTVDTNAVHLSNELLSTCVPLSAPISIITSYL